MENVGIKFAPIDSKTTVSRIIVLVGQRLATVSWLETLMHFGINNPLHRGIMEPAEDPTKITQRNIRAIYEHEQAELKKESLTTRVAHSVATWAGTVSFIIWHVLIFGGWVLLNLTMIKVDPFPFVLLTTIVSLESILLSGFLLLSQNKLSSEADKRHKLDLQINLLAEQESTAIMRILDRMAEKMGLSEEERREIQQLSDDTNPTDVLEQIVEIEKD